MEPLSLLPIVSVLSLVTVEYGGYALLSFLTGRLGGSPGPFKEQFFRAGHAHAGVLLILSLVYFIYLGRTEFSEGIQWLAGIILLAGIMSQSSGFFLHMWRGQAGQKSIGTNLTEIGALLIASALVILGIGLIAAL